MSIPPRFNLVDERFVPCEMVDGSVDTLGIRSIFEHAAKIARIASGDALFDCAMLRQLIAIANASVRPEVRDVLADFGVLSDDMLSEDAVVELEDLGIKWFDEFPYDEVSGYLDAHRDDFWLVGDNAFGQDRLLSDDEVISRDRRKSGRNRLFRGYTHDDNGMQAKSNAFDVDVNGDLTFAEAARLVIRTQSFDFGGKKTYGGTIGKLGGPNNLMAWAGRHANFIACGATLEKTLAINLQPLMLASSGDDDVPSWEIPTSDTYVAWRPRGILSSLSPLSRCVQLVVRGDMVVSSHVAHRENLGQTGSFDQAYLLDPCVGTYSDGKTIKVAGIGSERVLRRTFVDLLQSYGDDVSREAGLKAKEHAGDVVRQDVSHEIGSKPGSLANLQRLVSEGAIRREDDVRLCVTGVLFGDAFGGKVLDVVHDEIGVPAWFCGSDAAEVRESFAHAYAVGSRVVTEGLGSLGYRIAMSRGLGSKLASANADRVRANGMSKLDIVIESTLARITCVDDVQAAVLARDMLEDLRDEFKRIAAAEERECGFVEVLGHDYPDGSGGVRHYELGWAVSGFYRTLNDAIPPVSKAA